MQKQTLTVLEIQHAIVITLNRPQQGNSINKILLTEINDVLDQYENQDNIKAIILESNDIIFCAGMDFKSIFSEQKIPHEWISLYLKTLKRFTEISKIMIAKVNGKALAGGVGFITACDLVFASQQASFGLPEVLWGLLPANVLPFLIRRIGFQNAYIMTLSHDVITAKHAKQINLVDYLTDNVEEDIKKSLARLSRIDVNTIKHMKLYFQKLWIINSQTEELAAQTLANLMETPLVQENIKNFIEYKKLPWEK